MHFLQPALQKAMPLHDVHLHGWSNDRSHGSGGYSGTNSTSQGQLIIHRGDTAQTAAGGESAPLLRTWLWS